MEDCEVVDTLVDKQPVNPIYYKSLVSCLRYLMCTQPNILFTVDLVSRYPKKTYVFSLEDYQENSQTYKRHNGFWVYVFGY